MLIAHRGVHNNKDIPENSIKSFKRAILKDYAIEFDIQITKDNKLVIFHDDNVKRMTGVDKNIQDMTYQEVKKLYLLDTKEVIPTFKHVLDLVDGKVLLDIEIKSTDKVDLITTLVLKELEDYNGQLLLKSFNPMIVRSLKKKTDKYSVGLLIMKKSPNSLLNFLVNTHMIYLFNPDFIAVSKKMLNKKFYSKHIKKYPIYVWTFKSMAEVDKYLSEYPKIICICNNLD